MDAGHDSFKVVTGRYEPKTDDDTLISGTDGTDDDEDDEEDFERDELDGPEPLTTEEAAVADGQPLPQEVETLDFVESTGPPGDDAH